MKVCATYLNLTRAVDDAEATAAADHRDTDLKGLKQASAREAAKGARIARAGHVLVCGPCQDNMRDQARAEILGAKAS